MLSKKKTLRHEVHSGWKQRIWIDEEISDEEVERAMLVLKNKKFSDGWKDVWGSVEGDGFVSVPILSQSKPLRADRHVMSKRAAVEHEGISRKVIKATCCTVTVTWFI